MESSGVAEGSNPEVVPGKEGSLVIVPVAQAEQWHEMGVTPVGKEGAAEYEKKRRKALSAETVGKGNAGKKLGSGGPCDPVGHSGASCSERTGSQKLAPPGPSDSVADLGPILGGPGVGSSSPQKPASSKCSPQKSSPSKIKSLGLNLGQGCCWGPGQVQGQLGCFSEEVRGAGQRELAGSGGVDEELEAELRARGKLKLAAARDPGLLVPGAAAGQPVLPLGSKGQGKKGGVKEKKGEGVRAGIEGQGRGSPGNSGSVRRERSRSPMGARRGQVGGRKLSGTPIGSGSGLSHGERVARIRSALLGDRVEEGCVTPAGEGGAPEGGANL